MRKRCICLAAGWFVANTALAWIDYGEHVPAQEPGFGKAFQGFALQLQTAAAEFRQGSAAAVKVTIRNENARATLHPEQPPAKRFRKLFLVLADDNGRTLFSDNLLGTANTAARGRIPPMTNTELVRVSFDALAFVPVREYSEGLPVFANGAARRAAAELVPRIYTLKAVLLAGPDGGRPDFSLASNPWQILLRPKEGQDMTEAEQRVRLDRYLAKLREGAYGGIAVSSQLAALGDIAVAPLIEVAETAGAGTARESRIWAIVTLCNTASPRAEEYIRKRLRDPVDAGDLDFLAWHSQGLRSSAVRDLLRDLAREIVRHPGTPWDTPTRELGPDAENGFLEFMCKHFARAGLTIGDEIARGCLQRNNPKVAAFAAAVWEPTSPRNTLDLLKPFFLQPMVHPNLQAALLRRLQGLFGADGCPALADEPVETVWVQAGIWLEKQYRFEPGQFAQFLAAQVLSVRTAEARAVVCEQLRRETAVAKLPDPEQDRVRAWIAAWQWALRQGGFDAPTSVRFLCREMRAEQTLTNAEKRALLSELRRCIGPDFPLPDPENIDPEQDWNRGGRWLVDHGYFQAGTPATP